MSSRAVRARVAAGGGDSAVVAVQSPAPRPACAGRKSSSRGGTCWCGADCGVMARPGRATARGCYLHHASPARLGRVDERVVQVKEDRAHPIQPHRFGCSSRARAASAASRMREADREAVGRGRGVT